MHQNTCLRKVINQLICLGNRVTGKPSVAEQKRTFPVNRGTILFMSVLLGFFLSLNATARQKHRSSFVFDQLKRAFKIYVPSTYSESVPAPLLLALHGKGGNGASMILLTRSAFNKLSEKEGFIVVYPDGVEKNWNDGRKDDSTNDRAHRENIDDVGFLSAMIDTLMKRFNIDKSRIYVTGMSNGAIMSYRLACELAHRITAIAPVTGNMTPLLIPGCSPSGHIPVLAINGADDPVVPFAGGEISGPMSRVTLGKVMSTEESVMFWVKKNGCSPVPALTEIPDNDPGDGTRTTIKSYTNHSDGTAVVLYTVTGGGHTWPGGFQYLPKKLIGKTSRDFNAAEVIWSFFKNISRLY